MAYRRFPALFLCSLLLAGGVRAAELGEPRIGSYRGQALVADIELSGLDDPATALQVRVANPDVYRGASMSVPPALSSLQLSVVKQGSKQFVHVTSTRPVDTEMLLLFLELGQGANRDVRLATLFLVPDPHPAPPPPPPAPVVVAAPLPAPLITVKPEARPELPIHAAPSTSLPSSVRAAPARSCKAASANQACAVADTRNLALQAKLTGLEGKIKLLEATLAPVQGTPTAVASSTPIAAIKLPPKPVKVVAKPKKTKPVEAAPASTPWLWIGIAAFVGLLAIGAIVFLLLRRRANKAPAEPGQPKGPGIMAGVRKRLMPVKVEPVIEA